MPDNYDPRPVLQITAGGHGIVDEVAEREWNEISTRVRIDYQPDPRPHVLGALLRLESLKGRELPDPLNKPWDKLSAGDCVEHQVTPARIHEQLYSDAVGTLKEMADLLCMLATVEATRHGSMTPQYIDPRSGYGIPEYKGWYRPAQIAVVSILRGSVAQQSLALVVRGGVGLIRVRR